MSNAGAVVIACLLIVCATLAAALHVMPSEAYAAILGGFVPGLALVIQRNTYSDAIKRSIRPPPHDGGGGGAPDGGGGAPDGGAQ